MPYEVKSDNGVAFRKEWEEELIKLDVRVLQSMGLVERSVRTLKEILHKHNNLSQLLLQEQIFAVNCKEESQTGSDTENLGEGNELSQENSAYQLRRKQDLRCSLPPLYENLSRWSQI